MALFHRRSELISVFFCKAGDGQIGEMTVVIRVELYGFSRLQAAFEVLAVCFPVQSAKRCRTQTKADFHLFTAAV